jgi:hypothetical protein
MLLRATHAAYLYWKGTEAMPAKNLIFDDPRADPTSQQSTHRTLLCDFI